MQSEKKSSCKVCGQPLGTPFLDFGNSPIADSLSIAPGGDGHTEPLAVCWCADCCLMQLQHHVDPQSIYNDAYPYFSSAISTLVQRMQILADDLVQQYALDQDSLVVEIASNDGYLLQHFRKQGLKTLGIEPCQRQAEISTENGIETINRFFNSGMAKKLRKDKGQADLIIANNVIAHVPDINDFVEGVASLLSDNGTAVFEFHHGMEMMRQLEYDTIYHQHIFYLTLTSLQKILQRHSLFVLNAEKIYSYGNSLRVHVAKDRPPADSVAAILEQEKNFGVCKAETCFEFASQVKSHSRELTETIDSLIEQGKRIAGYGAPAKATTLTHGCGLGEGKIDFVVDRNVYKHQLYLPGTDIQIFHPFKLESEKIDYLVIFAWNYADEIMAGLESYRQHGGKFIIPVPEIRIV